MSLTLARIFKYNVGIKYNNIMKPGSITGQKRKLSPDSNERPTNELSISESLIGPSKLKPVKTQLFKYGRWEKWEENGKVFYYNRPLRKSVYETPYQRFIKDYENYKASYGIIDGIHFANKKIMSIIEPDKSHISILDKDSYKKESYKKAIEYLSELLESYMFYKHETSGSNLTIRDILEINVHGTGHGGEEVAMPKDINPQYAPDIVWSSIPSGIFAWGEQKKISEEYALMQHINGKPFKRGDKEHFRKLISDYYKTIATKYHAEMKAIALSLIRLRNIKEEILSELNDPENPDAKINVVRLIAPSMSCCPNWKNVEQKESFYTKKDVDKVKTLFFTAESILNETRAYIQEKYEHSSLGVERSMTESFKCYDSTSLTDKRNIGQCIQTLSSGPDDYRGSYPNFKIWFRVRLNKKVNSEKELMLNAMLDTLQIGNESLFENREGYKLNEKGFPFLMIEQLYKAFLGTSPNYRNISRDDSIYPTKLVDLLGPIGKVSTYGSYCCRKGHKPPEMEPYDSEGGRKKTRKRIRGNNRNRAKTRGRKLSLYR